MAGSALIATTIIAALVISACGVAQAGTDSAPARPAPHRHVPAFCPHPRPARSSPASPDALAPGHPTWTSFCIYLREGVVAKSGYADGPLDRVLNASLPRLSPVIACPAVARLPAVVVLRYATGSGHPSRTRHVVLDMSGCPQIVMSNGRQRPLRDRGAAVVLRYYVAAGATR